MTEQPPIDLIRYDILTQQALRSVVYRVLDEVRSSGLPGDHHFFITFDTTFPGVRLSKRMREKYPDEMTIVIQHTYWDLEVSDTEFEIDLSFDEIRERLRIPYTAVKAFFDPSVKFGLQFDVSTETDGSDNDAQLEQEPSETIALVEEDREPTTLPARSAPREVGKAKPRKKASAEDKTNQTAPKKSAGAELESAEDTESAEVVSLDAFRKKK